MYFLAAHPGAQKELRAEVDSVLGTESVLPEYASLTKLRYLGAVAHESLRLKSPVPFVALSAARDVTISDIAVPEGTPVFLLLREVARNAACFPDSDRFDPHRRLAGDSAVTRADFARASLPFGAGPRVCPGRQLALLECSR